MASVPFPRLEIGCVCEGTHTHENGSLLLPSVNFHEWYFLRLGNSDLSSPKIARMKIENRGIARMKIEIIGGNVFLDITPRKRQKPPCLSVAGGVLDVLEYS